MAQTKAHVEVIADFRALLLYRNASGDGSASRAIPDCPAECRGAVEVNFETIARKTQRAEVGNIWRPKAARVIKDNAEVFHRGDNCPDPPGKVMNAQAVIGPQRCAPNQRTVGRPRLIRSSVTS